jgi:hypothetical protein
MNSLSNATIEHEIGTEGIFVLRLRDGSVRLRGADGRSVRVAGEEGTDLEETFLVERGAGSLSIGTGKGLRIKLGRGHHATPRLSVDVPRAATVVVEASSADLTAEDLVGEQRYQTVSGDMLLTRVRGQVAIDAVSGDVRLSAGGDLRLRARTVSGDLEVRAGRLGDLSLATTSGDLSIAGELMPDGTHRVETVSGDTLLAIAGGARVEVTTVTGDVTSDVAHRSEGGRGRRVLIVGDGRATLTASSMSGDVRIVRARPFETGPNDAPEPEPPPAPAAPPPVTPTQAADASGAAIAAAYESARLGILRSVERGEIDVAEAGRRLEALDAADVQGSSTDG